MSSAMFSLYLVTRGRSSDGSVVMRDVCGEWGGQPGGREPRLRRHRASGRWAGCPAAGTTVHRWDQIRKHPVCDLHVMTDASGLREELDEACLDDAAHARMAAMGLMPT
jgi:hypothetical protein